MNKDEYKKKFQELQEVARAIDVWKNATPKPENEKKVERLWEELEAESYDLECKLLEVKLKIFKKVLEILKS